MMIYLTSLVALITRANLDNPSTGKTCNDYEKENREKFRIDRKFISEETVTCPNLCCRAPIQKSEGCNHMSCVR